MVHLEVEVVLVDGTGVLGLDEEEAVGLTFSGFLDILQADHAINIFMCQLNIID